MFFSPTAPNPASSAFSGTQAAHLIPAWYHSFPLDSFLAHGIEREAGMLCRVVQWENQEQEETQG